MVTSREVGTDKFIIEAYHFVKKSFSCILFEKLVL